jgi:RNA polymerase sigma factor (sigma-70 family)
MNGPPADSASDDALLDVWRSGDAAAGSELCRRYAERLYRFFCNKVSAGVDDLVQETLLACVETEHNFERRGSFQSFLFGIARFKLYAHYRKAKRDGLATDFEAVTVFDLDPSPSHHAAANSEQRVLLEALRRLPLNLQIALELSYWEDLPAPEIAAILEIPTDTVYSRLRRAKQLLEQHLKRLDRAGARPEPTETNLEIWAAALKSKPLRGD